MKICRLLRHIYSNAVYKFFWNLTAGALPAILKKTTICLFHLVNNGCIVRKKNIIIALSSQYCLTVICKKIRVLLQLYIMNIFVTWSVRHYTQIGNTKCRLIKIHTKFVLDYRNKISLRKVSNKNIKWDSSKTTQSKFYFESLINSKFSQHYLKQYLKVPKDCAACWNLTNQAPSNM